MFLIIAYFTHEITIEERKLIPQQLFKSYRLQRNTTIVEAALFLVSTLPIFWSLTVFGFQVRFILWIGTLGTSIIRRELEGRMKSSSIRN